ncbi:hypothetical protein [Pseudomonas sp. OIL-1]|uniref:hypothetical protein n=1 Tax=Pseudomonas sp. OIL-1 TaxID=2706126 RepID=UPI0013A79A98|nr:hypothetical protein [Pseudomonas sp. OIL-1]QIB49729.1 hypothetical protein G3M63_00825 [Pseudomonas sp. OIL-1]
MALGIVLLLAWLILLVRFPRPMVPASLVLVGLALLLGAIVATMQWLDGRRADQLDMSVAYAPDACEFGKPLRVDIINNSAHTVTLISWRLLAAQPGFNTNLVDTSTTAATYRVDQSIPPEGDWTGCYRVPRLRTGYRAPDLDYRMDDVRAEFQ